MKSDTIVLMIGREEWMVQPAWRAHTCCWYPSLVGSVASILGVGLQRGDPGVTI